MFTNPLLLALVATTVTATYNAPIHPGILAAKRDLGARQTSTDSEGAVTSCIGAVLSIYSSAPTPPPEVLSWEESLTITDPCKLTVPGSISAAFSSYETEVLSWYTAHSSELFSALSQCPQGSSVAGASPSACAGGSGGGAGGAGGGSGATTTSAKAGATTSKSTSTSSPTGTGTGTASTGTGTSTGAGTSSSATKNAGPRETGFVAGAVVIAGFLGVVAAL